MAQEMARGKMYGLYPAYVLYRNLTPAFFPAPWVRHALGRVAPTCADAACLEMESYRGGERF
jgi:hypothetical protein